MKTFNLTRFAWLIIALFLASCGGGSARVTDGSLYIPEGGWTLSFPDDVATTDPLPDPYPDRRCDGPQPEPDGCGAPCKPCFFYVCKNGEWTRVAISWPEGLCDRRPRTELTNVCRRTPSGFCPAECHICI